MEALDLDYDQQFLSDIDEPIRQIVITNRGGSVTIHHQPTTIASFVKRHPNLAVEYRPEYGGYCTKTVGRYVSVCIKVDEHNA